MSSAAYLTCDPDDETPISREEWLAFCEEQNIEYSPNTIGRNVFYRDDVEINFGDPTYADLPRLPSGQVDFSKAEPPAEAWKVTVSTFSGGNLEGVAQVAALIWLTWNVLSLSADPEIQRALVGHLIPAEA